MLLHSGDELVEELTFVVDVWVIDDLGYEVLLVIVSAHVSVCIRFIENLLGRFLCFWLFLLLILLFGFWRKISLDSGTLFDHDRLRLLDLRHSLNGNGAGLCWRLGQQSAVKALRKWTERYLGNLHLEVIEFSNQRLIF